MSNKKMRFTGRDLAEALGKARREFKATRQDIGFEVTRSPSVGPLGEDSEDLEIEAWYQPGAHPAPARSDEGRGSYRDREPRGGRHRERRDRGGGAGRPRSPRDEHVPELPPLLPEASVTDAEQILRHLSATMIEGLDLDLRVREIIQSDVGLRVSLDGEDSEYLLQDDGKGLDALQFLANRVLQRDGRIETRVTFDSDGWRAESESRLIAHARRTAEEVRQSGETIALSPMGAYERRLIHMALAEEEGVRTFSSGDGHEKCLNIAPDEPSE